MCTDFLKERKEKKEQIKKESLQWTCCQVKDGIKKHDHDMVGTFTNYISLVSKSYEIGVCKLNYIFRHQFHRTYLPTRYTTT